jgi:hypothetical protein
VPLARLVDRPQRRTRFLQTLDLNRGVRRVANRVAEVRAEPCEDARVEQKRAKVRRLTLEHLFREELGEVLE